MSNPERRKHIRRAHHFKSSLFKLSLYSPANGVTADLSPGGVLIKTKNWDAFQANDQVVVTLFFPPDFSGQKKIISLQGAATVTRVDQGNGGVAIQFENILKQFERVDNV